MVFTVFKKQGENHNLTLKKENKIEIINYILQDT
jgi:hypothetical protein